MYTNIIYCNMRNWWGRWRRSLAAAGLHDIRDKLGGNLWTPARSCLRTVSVRLCAPRPRVSCSTLRRWETGAVRRRERNRQPAVWRDATLLRVSLARSLLLLLLLLYFTIVLFLSVFFLFFLLRWMRHLLLTIDSLTIKDVSKPLERLTIWKLRTVTYCTFQ